MFKNKILIYDLTLNAIRSLTLAFSVFYMMAYGLSLEQVGFIKAFQAALIFFLDVPLSYLADKISRRFSVLTAGLCSTIWLFLMAGAHSFASFVLAEFFNSLSLLLFSGTFVAYLLDNRSTSVTIETTLSHYHQYGKIGMALSCLIGSAFATVHSRWTWVVAGGSDADLLSMGSYLFTSRSQLNKCTQTYFKRRFKLFTQPFTIAPR